MLGIDSFNVATLCLHFLPGGFPRWGGKGPLHMHHGPVLTHKHMHLYPEGRYELLKVLEAMSLLVDFMGMLHG